jgi:hypothetical protein
MTNKDLIPVVYMLRSEFESFRRGLTSPPVEVIRSVSPFYEGERWVVRMGGRCVNVDGGLEFEPIPSDRDEKFYGRCRFMSLTDALAAYEKWKDAQ